MFDVKTVRRSLGRSVTALVAHRSDGRRSDHGLPAPPRALRDQSSRGRRGLERQSPSGPPRASAAVVVRAERPDRACRSAARAASSGRARRAPAGRPRAAGPGHGARRRSDAGSRRRPAVGRRAVAGRSSGRIEHAQLLRAPRNSLAVTPSSRIREPRSSGRASSSAARQIGSVRSVGSAQGPLAGDRAEARVADLDVDRAGLETRRAQPPGDAVGHARAASAR